MKIKRLIINFLGGVIGTLILLIPALFLLTIYLDNNNITNFTIGKGQLAAYTFYKSNDGFGMNVGPGLLLLALLGGFIVLLITLLIHRFIKIQYYD